jgi:hypothetical protein
MNDWLATRNCRCAYVRDPQTFAWPGSWIALYASYALDAGVTIFELARLMGTSVKVIDDTYGHLVRDTFGRVRRALEERARREAALSGETSDGSAGSS